MSASNQRKNDRSREHKWTDLLPLMPPEVPLPPLPLLPTLPTTSLRCSSATPAHLQEIYKYNTIDIQNVTLTGN